MTEVLPGGRQNLVEVVQAWMRGTAKEIARCWGVDPATAENARKGVVSTRTLQRVMEAEDWPFILAMGAAVTGKTYEQWLDDEIQKARAGAAELEALAERSRAARSRMAGAADEPRSFAPGRRNGRGSARSVGQRET